jgi:opacity protein-like surface antigen
MKTRWLGAAVAVALASSAWAEDGAAQVSQEEESYTEEARPEPVRKIRVLEDPYQISSFYRSESTGRYSVGYGYDGSSRYPIASFYRQGGEGRYSRFWNNPRGQRGSYRGGRVRVRALGGDDVLFFVPTVLGPAVPIATMYR